VSYVQLDLSWNNIGDSGASELAKAIATNHTLGTVRMICARF